MVEWSTFVAVLPIITTVIVSETGSKLSSNQLSPIPEVHDNDYVYYLVTYRNRGIMIVVVACLSTWQADPFRRSSRRLSIIIIIIILS